MSVTGYYKNSAGILVPGHDINDLCERIDKLITLLERREEVQQHPPMKVELKQDLVFPEYIRRIK